MRHPSARSRATSAPVSPGAAGRERAALEAQTWRDSLRVVERWGLEH